MKVTVGVKFETTAPRRFLIHDGSFVPFDGNGKGTMQVEEEEFDLILFGIEGTAGTAATITLTPPSTHSLEIAGHPIKGKIASGKTRWGGNRFFRLRRI